MLGAQAVGAVFVGRDERPGRLQRSPEAYRPVPHCKRGPRQRADPLRERLRRERARAGSTSAPPRHAAANASPRRASRTASTSSASVAPSASASSELTPTSGSPRACASARAVEIPIRSPVKLPGPTPTAIRSTSSQPSPACSERRLGGAQEPVRVPGADPRLRVVAHLEDRPDASRTPATVAVVAVSRPRTITSPPASGGRRPRGRARHGARSAARRAAPRARRARATRRT